MSDGSQSKPQGYDKYVNLKTLAIAVGLFVALLLVPTPGSMRDVAVEYSAGPRRVLEYFSQELFGKPYTEAAQWEASTCRILEKTMLQGVSRRQVVLGRNLEQTRNLGLEIDSEHFASFRAFLESVDEPRFTEVMASARSLRNEQLSYAELSPGERQQVDRAAWELQVCVALVAFVVVCFVTEAMPLPGVAFCIGLILVFFGIVSRQAVASLFWSDACWFIMGSLMFAAAFVKTGVDKRICLLLFRSLARPSVKWITAILILVIAPAAGFISDHALAAMFLPIAIVLYSNSLSTQQPGDRELAKMLVICIAMACNIGGFGSPSGGARNVIIMTYLEDMFGIAVGYAQWILFGFPFVLLMMPVLWLLLNARFKPTITDLTPALETLKRDIARMGGWNRRQVMAVTIFLVMLFGWITESNLLRSLLGFRLGIGVLAVAGAVAYLLFGVVNWRDYHEKVDWGVVWLYAGAIIFGRVLDGTGAAYWMARSVVEPLAELGLASGQVLVVVGSLVTSAMTNLMADGPAAAAVGPITLNMAAISAPGTTLIPHMGLATACSSSFAYLLIIGTPPNAIVYASGYLEPKDFLRVGVPCFLVAFLVLTALSILYWPLLGGFGGLLPI
jgi:sodium-dependent dicarboxylate transporter 2/3/5